MFWLCWLNQSGEVFFVEILDWIHTPPTFKKTYLIQLERSPEPLDKVSNLLLDVLPDVATQKERQIKNLSPIAAGQLSSCHCIVTQQLYPPGIKPWCTRLSTTFIPVNWLLVLSERIFTPAMSVSNELGKNGQLLSDLTCITSIKLKFKEPELFMNH